MGEQQPSEWQKKITGEWYGRPSVFDPDGNHVGYERVSRHHAAIARLVEAALGDATIDVAAIMELDE